MEEQEGASRSQAEYTPVSRQLISHEQALAESFEDAVTGLHEHRAARRKAREEFEARVAQINAQPLQREPIYMNQRDWDDIQVWVAEDKKPPTLKGLQNKPWRRKKSKHQRR